MYAIMLLPVLPIIFYEFACSYKNVGSIALSFKTVRTFNAQRLLYKLSGLAITYAFIAFFYWVFPVYKDDMFTPFWHHFRNIFPMVLILAIPYFIYVDLRMKNAEDAYFHLGHIITAQFDQIDWKYVWEHLRGWLVKWFFLPLMTVFVLNNFNYFASIDFSRIKYFPGDKFLFLNNSIFTADLIFAFYGYILTLRATNSQIYSADPTVFGWVVCLAGYPPFWTDLLFNRYFNYEDNYAWTNMVGDNSFFYGFWCSLIIITIVIYALATIAFGCRFSNLTYRGIITSGPYRFTKHPAYVFKNISWWLVSVPFIPFSGWEHALKVSILLFGVNCIYFMRARTEENHLSNYPEYVEYAEMMNEKSIFAFLGRRIPLLRYKKERGLKAKIYKSLV